MNIVLILTLIALASANNARSERKTYQPNWMDLKTRPLPAWYDRAKVGIFIHWGVYSVPAVGSEWFQYLLKLKEKKVPIDVLPEDMAAEYQEVNKCMKSQYPGLKYQDLALMFTAEQFDPYAWADLFVKAGVRYVVFTAKHHDGYTLFPSKHSPNWNAMEVGPKRDIVNDLSIAVRNRSMKFGLYYSLSEFEHPDIDNDRFNEYETADYVKNKMFPEIKDMICLYEPSVLWADGDKEAASSYWNSTHILAWLYNESPVRDVVVANDRWGHNIHCRGGDFRTCSNGYNPGRRVDFKFENAFKIDTRAWCYRKDIAPSDVLQDDGILHELISSVSFGGNVLINIGPSKDGTIPEIFQERLLSLGKWLETNGEAIYDTSPWHEQLESDDRRVWFTCKKTPYRANKPTATPRATDVVTAVYAIFMDWPKDDVLRLRAASKHLEESYKVRMLGYEGKLSVTISGGEASIVLPNRDAVKSQLAWALEFIPQNSSNSI